MVSSAPSRRFSQESRRRWATAGSLRTWRFFPWVLLLVLASPPLVADGKFYVPRDVPRMGGPFQRALVLHDSGKEFLLIQPKAVGKAKHFGWIVPTPSVPAVGTMDAEATADLFYQLARQSAPRFQSLSSVFYGTALVIVGLCAILALASGRKRLGIAAFVIFLVITFFSVGFVFFLRPAGVPGVEIVGSARVGIYDARIVRATEPEALRAWLEQHGFTFGVEDEGAFRSYVDRGWSFVTARVAKDAAVEKLERVDGLLQPLVLLFDSSEPVYPYALTATAGQSVEVVLYVAAKQRVQCPLLDTDYSGAGWVVHPYTERIPEATSLFVEKPGEFVTWSLGVESKPESVDFLGARWLTKLRAAIAPGEVTGDLVLAPGPESSYRKTIWRW